MIKMSNIKKNEILNASWLIGGRIAQMLLSLLVSIVSARFLGPNRYGLIGYANAYMSFFMAFCTLGINSVIIKDFVDHPEDQGKTIGTSIGLRILSSIFCTFMIGGIVAILDKDEPLTIIVVVLSSISLLFHAFDTFCYWFQFQYNSKYTAIAAFVSSFVTSLYKIVLLILNCDIKLFAIASSIEYVVYAAMLYIIYRKNKGPYLSFSIEKGKKILKSSYHYILSGMMVAIYGQTDKLMIKQLIDSSEVAYYTTALSICTMWTFVLQAIIDSIYPSILSLKSNKEEFDKKNKQLYAIVFYISIFVSIMISLFGDIVIKLFYGEQYLGAIAPLKVITWYVAFSYLGVARNAWIVCENKQNYLKYMYLGAAIINILLNLIFIPLWGTTGAALASLITQIFTSIGLPLTIKALRPNAKLMLEAIFFIK